MNIHFEKDMIMWMCLFKLRGGEFCCLIQHHRLYRRKIFDYKFPVTSYLDGLLFFCIPSSGLPFGKSSLTVDP